MCSNAFSTTAKCERIRLYEFGRNTLVASAGGTANDGQRRWLDHNAIGRNNGREERFDDCHFQFSPKRITRKSAASLLCYVILFRLDERLIWCSPLAPFSVRREQSARNTEIITDTNKSFPLRCIRIISGNKTAARGEADFVVLTFERSRGLRSWRDFHSAPIRKSRGAPERPAWKITTRAIRCCDTCMLSIGSSRETRCQNGDLIKLCIRGLSYRMRL